MVVWIGLGIMILVTAFWVWPGIDVQRIPEQQFPAAGTDKFMWKAIVAYLRVAGGII
jgi:hypothetical protein